MYPGFIMNLISVCTASWERGRAGDWTRFATESPNHMLAFRGMCEG